jgi:RNA polymerase sigma-70 factor (ECF subfamily)
MNLTEKDILEVLMTWRTRISAAAWVIVRDTHAAEDIFQNVAVKAITRNVTFETERSLLSWAFITARHESVEWLRRNHREALGLDSEILDLLDQEWKNAAHFPSGSRIDALQECLASAADSSRQLLKLRYFEGYSCEEIADRMSIGLDAIYKRISRLHQSLKECIESKLRQVGEDASKEAP